MIQPSPPEFVPPARGVALFDLDGTLLAWDCQLLFRHFVLRRHPWRAWLLPIFLAAVPLAPWLGCSRMKQIFLSYLWRIDAGELDSLSRDFGGEVARAIFPEMRKRIEKHRQQGDLLVLASASPECYVREIGRELGFSVALGTPVTFGPLLPQLANHKGAAKVTRLHSLFPSSAFSQGRLLHSHGYTDSTADLPMLRLCERVTVVNPKAPLAKLADAEGWEIIRTPSPWTSPLGWAARSLALLLGFGRDPGGLTTQSEKNPETPCHTPRA